jgi:RHS repeat-associated protein
MTSKKCKSAHHLHFHGCPYIHGTLVFVWLFITLLLADAVRAQEPGDTAILGNIATDKIIGQVAQAPDRDIAFGITGYTKEVYLLDLIGYQVKGKVTLETIPRAIAVHPKSNLAYVIAPGQVVGNAGGSLSIIDGQGKMVRSTAIPRSPKGIAIDSTNDTVAVTYDIDKKVIIYAADTIMPLKEISLPCLPGLIAVDADSGRAVIAARETWWSLLNVHLLIVDLPSGLVVNDINLRTGITGLAIDSGKDIAVVSSIDKIHLINTSGGNTITTIPSGLLANLTAFKNSVFPRIVPGNPDILDMYFSVDVNMASHIAIGTGNQGFLLIDLDRMTYGYHPLQGANITLAAAADRDRNSVLISYLKPLTPTSWAKGVADVQLPNPLPMIQSVLPAEAARSSSDQLLNITGQGFIRSSSVSFAGQLITTTFLNNETLAAIVPGRMLQTPGTFPIEVMNPTPSGGVSGGVSFKVLNPVPILTAIAPASVPVGQPGLAVSLSGVGFAGDTILSVNGQAGPTTLISATQMQVILTPADLATAGGLLITAKNPPPGGGTSNVMTLSVLNPAPVLAGISPQSAVAGSGAMNVTLTGSGFTAQSTVSLNGAAVPVAFVSSTQLIADLAASLLTFEGAYPITVSNPQPGGGTTAPLSFAVTKPSNIQPLPEDSFGKAYADLVPPDATIERYDPKRFSVITGLVKDMGGNPLPGVAVSILNNARYGSTRTDVTGRFGLPTDGGTTCTMVYRKPGFITAQRQVYAPWNDIAVVETPVLVAEDPASTAIAFDGNPSTTLGHRSTPYTDGRGTRSATVVFSGDNAAYIKNPDGTETITNSITVRATEFTTPESMPAKLPPTSAYTYCAELVVDGAQNVRFAKPVTVYVDNFLGFHVGMSVPVGYYDRDRGVWAPSDNGRVVRLLDTNDDSVVDAYDDVGDGQAHGMVTGLDDPTVYTPGSTFWRVTISHFTPWDLNWPVGPPPDAIAPNPQGSPSLDQPGDEKPDCPDEECAGSYTEARARVLHENIPIAGTGMSLHYASSRVPGYKAVISVPASGSTVPASLKNIVVNLQVAGRTFETTLSPEPNQKAVFVWDGLDGLGRWSTTSVNARVAVGFAYQGVYYTPGSVGQTFAQAGTGIGNIPARQDVVSWREYSRTIEPIHRPFLGNIGSGWTVSEQHYVNPSDPSTLYMGQGSINRNNTSWIITTIAGNGSGGFGGDGGLAVEAALSGPRRVAVNAAGDIYITEGGNATVRKVSSEGTIVTIAGNGDYWHSGDGGPALEAGFSPLDIAVDGAGNLYIADPWNYVVRKIDANGIITTAAGNRTSGFGGDGGPAVSARVDPRGVATDEWGNLYIADGWNRRIRKVDPNGTITTFAGNGTGIHSGDSGAAVNAGLIFPTAVTVDAGGNVYIGDFARVRRVDRSGIITTIAGNGSSGFSGDGGPAVNAMLGGNIYAIAVDEVGNLYLVDSSNARVRKVDTSGTIVTIAGNGLSSSAGQSNGDGGPAVNARFGSIVGLAVDPLGSLYVSDYYDNRIRMIVSPQVYRKRMEAGGYLFSDADGFGYFLDRKGLHLSTIDLASGVTLRSFKYDADRLISVIDASGNATTIQRDAAGTAVSITSPDSLVTALTVDGNGDLTGMIAPDKGTYAFGYAIGSLLTTKVDHRGRRFSHTFDANGRVADVSDPEGGKWTYTKTDQLDGSSTVTSNMAEGNATTYQTRMDSTGAYTSITTTPSNNVTTFSSSADGLTDDKKNSCGTEEFYKYDLDPQYKYKYVRELKELMTSGLTRTVQTTKTYQDTNGDRTPDMITAAKTLNGKTARVQTNIIASTSTTTSPLGRIVTSTYDPITLLTTSTTVPGLLPTTFGYDARGRPISTTTGARTTAVTYNGKGFVDTLTLPDLRTMHYTYDDVGRITTKLFPGNITIALDYDANGNMTALTNPSAVSYGFDYTGVNLRKTMTMPLSGIYAYAYDKERNLKSVTFPSGKQLGMIYLGSLLRSATSPEGTTSYNYLCGQNLTDITRGAESVSYAYDGALLTRDVRTGLLSQSIAYVYNSDFNVASITYAGASQILGYDNDGLLTASSPFTITRDMQNGLPLALSDGMFTERRSYSGYGELDSLSYSIGSANPYAYVLSRDAAGRVTQRQEVVGDVGKTYEYNYDEAGRLAEVKKDGAIVESYTYDVNGNRQTETNTIRSVNRSYTVSPEDRIITAGSATYQFDVDGFLTSRTAGSLTTTYQYSSRGELLSVTIPSGTVITYEHDPLGRRIAKKVNGTITEKYLWRDATALLALYDGANNLISRFVYADGKMPVSMTYGGNAYYLLYDQIGSLRVVADSAGTVTKRIDYDTYGSIINETNPAMATPFGFAGGLFDKDTGFVRFGARDYDPATGRWTSMDPIDYAGGDSNLYGYVANDPVNGVDPSGLLAAPWHFGLSLAAGLSSGMGIGNSLSFAWNSTAVDFVAGSQGFDATATAQHAMAGVLPDGTRQSPREAISAASNFTQSNKACGNLAKGAHAAQDLATPGHVGKPWTGFGWNWDTASHVLGDVFPSPSTIRQAYRNTLGVLK